MFPSFISSDTLYYKTFKAFSLAVGANPRGSYRQRELWSQVMRFMRVYPGAEVTVTVLSDDRMTSTTHILLRRGVKCLHGVIVDEPNTLLYLKLRTEDLALDASSHITLNMGAPWSEVPFHFRVDWFQKTDGTSKLTFALTKREQNATLKEIDSEIKEIVNDLPILLSLSDEGRE